MVLHRPVELARLTGQVAPRSRVVTYAFIKPSLGYPYCLARAGGKMRTLKALPSILLALSASNQASVEAMSKAIHFSDKRVNQDLTIKFDLCLRLGRAVARGFTSGYGPVKPRARDKESS
jgi:hypothetical protein